MGLRHVTMHSKQEHISIHNVANLNLLNMFMISHRRFAYTA